MRHIPISISGRRGGQHMWRGSLMIQTQSRKNLWAVLGRWGMVTMCALWGVNSVQRVSSGERREERGAICGVMDRVATGATAAISSRHNQSWNVAQIWMGFKPRVCLSSCRDDSIIWIIGLIAQLFPTTGQYSPPSPGDPDHIPAISQIRGASCI